MHNDVYYSKQSAMGSMGGDLHEKGIYRRQRRDDRASYFDRLHGRTDIQLLTLPESERKLESSRKRLLNEADVVFLCLPDDAAREAASWVENPDAVVLDTSTAHRTAPGWCYGFPELSPVQEARLRQAKRIAVPGCHASGFIALVYPLISAGLLAPDVLLSCYSLTGYSGGGKR